MKRFWSYVYEIKHIPTGKVYVGSRCAKHKLKTFQDCYTDDYYGSSSNKLFKKNVIKNNKNDYIKTVLKVFYSEHNTTALDYENGDNGLIATYKKIYGDKCVNKHYFKDGQNCYFSAGRKISEDEKKQMVARFSEANKNRKQTDEQINKRVASRKKTIGDSFSKEWRENLSLSAKGRKHSDAAKQKMRDDGRQRIWINNGVERKFIKKGDLHLYENWKRGKKL